MGLTLRKRWRGLGIQGLACFYILFTIIYSAPDPIKGFHWFCYLLVCLLLTIFTRFFLTWAYQGAG